MRLLIIAVLSFITLTGYGQCQWDRFKKATDSNTPEGKALEDAIDGDPSIIDDWEKLDKAGVRDVEVGYGKVQGTSGEQKWLDDLKDGVYRNGNKAEYANPAGNRLKWTDQHPNSIDIEGALPKDGIVETGKHAEAVVADFIQKQGKEIEGFGLKVDNSTLGGPAGDIDVLTKNEIIEVKKSYSSWSSKPLQTSKFTDSANPNYLNPNGKNAILYINKPLTAAQKADILSTIPSDVTLVNSLSELQTILK